MGEIQTTVRAGGRRRTPARRALGAVAVLGALAAGACAAPVPVVPESPVPFTKHVIDSVPGAAFSIEADVWGDASPEILLSSFGKPAGGPGRVGIYTRGASLTDWTRTDVVTPADDIKFPNDVTAADVDLDGDKDIIVPAGFFTCEFAFAPCGSLQWFEQDGANWVRHQIVAPGNPRFYHVARLTDLDGDGILDLVTVSETSNSAQVEWFRGTTDTTRFETTPRVIGAGGGSIAILDDVDGDGDADVVSPQYFGGVGYVWFEQVAAPDAGNPTGTWTKHVMTTATGGGFTVEKVANLRGDGVDRWLVSNHVGDATAGVYLLDEPADPRDPWGAAMISTGIQVALPVPGSLAPGFFGTGDIDGDGRIDVAVSGDGDDRLFWLRQEADGSFTTFVVDPVMGQAGGARVVDFDGNGTNELLFSSYEQDNLVIYER